MRLLEAIAVIAPFTHTKADQTALMRHADMIERGSQEGITEELDRNDVKERYLAAVKAIEQAWHEEKRCSVYQLKRILHW